MVVNWRSKAGAALALLAPLLLLASCRELEPDDPLPDWGNPN